MAGAGLLDIKRRIRSVKNTQKITRAVGLVYTAKFRKVRANAYSVTPYLENFRESLMRIMSSGDVEDSIYLRENDSDVDLYIIITSDTGLCGSYNMNVINQALRHMHGKKVVVTTVGGKGRSYFTRRGYDTLAEYVEVGESPSMKEINEIVKSSVDFYAEGKAKNVYLVYTKFYSQLKQDVEVIRMLPAEKGEAESRVVEFEPSADKVFDFIMPRYLNSLVYYAVVNGIASEYATRIRAMDSATKNASELLTKLQIMYNKTRQSSITQEITEIVGGAEALKD